jgi:hypothetical protein
MGQSLYFFQQDSVQLADGPTYSGQSPPQSISILVALPFPLNAGATVIAFASLSSYTTGDTGGQIQVTIDSYQKAKWSGLIGRWGPVPTYSSQIPNRDKNGFLISTFTRDSSTGTITFGFWAEYTGLNFPVFGIANYQVFVFS